MLKNLIIVEGENDYQCDTLEEVVNKLVCENYYELTTKEKEQALERVAIANTLNKSAKIVKEDNSFTFEGKIIIKDEITYVLSLLIANIIVLLERRDVNIFVKNINLPNDENNYIIVNKFANKLLKNYLKDN